MWVNYWKNLFPAAIGTILFVGCVSTFSSSQSGISASAIRGAEKLAALNYTDEERSMAQGDLERQAESYRRLREFKFDPRLSPAYTYSPFQGKLTNKSVKTGEKTPKKTQKKTLVTPRSDKNYALYSISELQAALNKGTVTSEDLVRYFLARIKSIDPKLQAFISIREESAIKEARKLDQERRQGKPLRSPLHGIPFAAKDIFATSDLKTTWGAVPYKDQKFNYDAEVIDRLNKAGAILIGKTALGALAWGDIWFEGQTKNPWNMEEGSTGSSSGSAAAVSAGLVPFALGTETWGSLITPAEKTAVSAIRPSVGRVSRYGAMPLSWTMDKVGVLCRHINDCAMALAQIQGQDDKDPTTISASFEFDEQKTSALPKRIGYISAEGLGYSDQYNSWYKKLTADLGAREIRLPGKSDLGVEVSDLSLIINAEASAAFSELTLSNRDDMMVRQMAAAYPNYFRAARFIPATEYVQMNRIRRSLLEKTEKILSGLDFILAPAQGPHLLLTNLTGHPAVYIPLKKIGENEFAGITLIGAGLEEAELLEAARGMQDKSKLRFELPSN